MIPLDSLPPLCPHVAPGRPSRIELQRIGANLNQVARALHSGAVQVPAGTLEAVERVADLVADLLTGEGLG